MSGKPIGFFYRHTLICTCCVGEMLESGELAQDADAILDEDGETVKPAFSDGYPDGFTCDMCDWNVGGVE